MIRGGTRLVTGMSGKPRASGDDPVLGDLFTWLWT